MNRARMMALSCLGALALIVGIGAVPAEAAFIRLCSGYDSCQDQGMSHFGYKKAKSKEYWRMTAGHNCTNYVAYRLVGNGMANERPWTTTGNAYNWGLANVSITNLTPTAGSVAWWGAHAKPMGASGHVAYVEKVVSADEIIISEDNWHGDFHWRRVTRASYWPTGFIHFKDAGSKPGTVKPAPSKRYVPKIAAALSASTVRVKSRVNLRGSTSRTLAGQKLYRQGYWAHRWHTWNTTKISSTGTFKFTIRPTKKAVNTYRVYIKSSSKHTAAASPNLILHAK